MTRELRLVLMMLFAASSCGGDDEMATPTVDATPCVPGDTELAVTSPNAYACRESFEATVTLTNRSCASVTVQEVRIAAAVTSGACAPAGPGTYTPMTTRVNHGQTATVLDLTGGAFCCLAPGCPSTLQDESSSTRVKDRISLATASRRRRSCRGRGAPSPSR